MTPTLLPASDWSRELLLPAVPLCPPAEGGWTFWQDPDGAPAFPGHTREIGMTLTSEKMLKLWSQALKIQEISE